ncbi:unnamed protein product [Mytilus coruscus]|uniref:Uncharacterized protein n=1 Tax=Mytilus coruscus TaxID=42192 RepID=A0A6J8BKA1_MYTCO|nr:unnamed protein product [Mytilus coruscus]
MKGKGKRNQNKVGNQAHLLRLEHLATNQGCSVINSIAPTTAPSTQALKNSSVQISPTSPKLEFSYSTTDLAPQTTTKSVWLPRLTKKKFKLYDPLCEKNHGYEIGKLMSNYHSLLLVLWITDGDVTNFQGLLEAMQKIVDPLWLVNRLADTIHNVQSQFHEVLRAKLSVSMFPGTTKTP